MLFRSVAVIGGVIMGLTLCVLADWLIVLFAGEDEQMRRIGVICMATQALALPIHGWVCVVNMYCAGIGDARGALALVLPILRSIGGQLTRAEAKIQGGNAT